MAHLLAVVSPGPDFAMVVRQSIAHGRRTAVWTSIGIGSAILLHIVYSFLGIALLLRSSPAAFTVVKFAGAAYLAWIGIKSLVSRSWLAPSTAGRERAMPRPGWRSAWASGFLTNALNPKATLFFLAIFASVIDPRTPRVVLAAYGAWMSAATMVWFSMVSYFFTREAVRNAFLRAGPWIDRAMGAVFIALSALLAFAPVSRP